MYYYIFIIMYVCMYVCMYVLYILYIVAHMRVKVHGLWDSTGVQGNPYTSPDQSGMVTRKEPSLRRTVSVRGILHLTNKQKQRVCNAMPEKPVQCK